MGNERMAPQFSLSAEPNLPAIPTKVLKMWANLVQRLQSINLHSHDYRGTADIVYEAQKLPSQPAE